MKHRKVKKDEILEEDDDDTHDLYETSIGLCKKIKFKSLIFLFILFIIISSDVFIEQMLDKFSNSVEHNCPTSKGVIVQGIFLVLGFVILDTLVNSDLI